MWGCLIFKNLIFIACLNHATFYVIEFMKNFHTVLLCRFSNSQVMYSQMLSEWVLVINTIFFRYSIIYPYQSSWFSLVIWKAFGSLHLMIINLHFTFQLEANLEPGPGPMTWFTMQRRYEEILAFMKIFECQVKFWTLLYGSKAKWSRILKRPNWYHFSKVSSKTLMSVPFIWHTSYPITNSWG